MDNRRNSNFVEERILCSFDRKLLMEKTLLLKSPKGKAAVFPEKKKLGYLLYFEILGYI